VEGGRTACVSVKIMVPNQSYRVSECVTGGSGGPGPGHTDIQSRIPETSSSRHIFCAVGNNFNSDKDGLHKARDRKSTWNRGRAI
jgi:hypothetical protein